MKYEDYPGRLLCIKEWRENKVYTIAYEDLIGGNFEAHEEVIGMKFDPDIK